MSKKILACFLLFALLLSCLVIPVYAVGAAYADDAAAVAAEYNFRVGEAGGASYYQKYSEAAAAVKTAGSGTVEILADTAIDGYFFDSDPSTEKSITINGNNHTVTAGNNAFKFDGKTNLTIQNVTINSTKSVIKTFPNVTAVLTNVTVNSTDTQWGAVINAGTMTLNNTVINDSTATGKTDRNSPLVMRSCLETNENAAGSSPVLTINAGSKILSTNYQAVRFQANSGTQKPTYNINTDISASGVISAKGFEYVTGETININVSGATIVTTNAIKKVLNFIDNQFATDAAAVEAGFVARVGAVGGANYYKSYADAFTVIKANNGGTIDLLANLSIPADQQFVGDNATFTINGHNFTATVGNNGIKVKGTTTLVINDLTVQNNGQVTMIKTFPSVVATLNNVTVTDTNNKWGAIVNAGKMTLNGCTFSSSSAQNAANTSPITMRNCKEDDENTKGTTEPELTINNSTISTTVTGLFYKQNSTPVYKLNNATLIEKGKTILSAPVFTAKDSTLRLTGTVADSGIRFTNEVANDWYNTLTENGSTVTLYTLIATKSVVDGKDYTDAGYKKIEIKKFASDVTSAKQFHAAIVDLTNDQLTLDLVGVPSAVITVPGIGTATYYGTATTANVQTLAAAMAGDSTIMNTILTPEQKVSLAGLTVDAE